MSLLHRLGALATALLALASCTAEDPIVQQLSIAPLASDTLYTGRSYQLEVRTTPEVDAPRLSWSVSDASLASIQYGGLLKPLASGEVTVYVTSLNSGGQRVRSSRRFLLLSSGVYLRDKSLTLNPLERYTLGTQYLPADYRPSEPVHWSSSAPDIVRVDQSGQVEALQEGEAVVRVRLGDPLSSTFSEDSVTITVSHHEAPSFTYREGILELTQRVPGLLPQVAKDIPFFTKIIVHGPVNGSDLLFFVEQRDKIATLDLGDAQLSPGGRGITRRRRWNETKDPEPIRVTEGRLPDEFATGLQIKRLTLPLGIQNELNFNPGYSYELLRCPEGYSSLSLGTLSVQSLELPRSLRQFYCGQSLLPIDEKEGSEERELPSITKELSLPESLEELRLLAKLSAPLSLPRGLRAVTLQGSYSDVRFAPTTQLRSLDHRFSLLSPAHKPSYGRASFGTLTLPEGLERLAPYALAASVWHSYTASGTIQPEQGCALQALRLPSTLRHIDRAALFALQLKGPLTLPEGLLSLGDQALYAAAITEITLPSTLQSIGQQALAQCKALELVRCLAKTPPSLGAAAFFRPTQSERIARLLVPRGTKQAYSQAGYGSYFFQIDELP